MFNRSGSQPVLHVVRPGDLIPDNRLLPSEPDLLEHEAIAKGLAEIALTATTPVNIALFGAWGSGKSSIYTMVGDHLADITGSKVKVARYDAWKYGGKELKRNFVESLAADLQLGNDPELSAGLESSVSDTRIDLGSWFWKNRNSLLFGLLLAVGLTVLWVLTIAIAVTIITETTFAASARRFVPQAGTVFGFALLAALLGPKVLEGAAVTTVTPAPEGADQFARRFKKLVEAARGDSPYPLVVFIDELDRCAPSDVVATLRDLKTFLDQPHCAFIVAADREVIVRALREEVSQAKPVREEEPYYATPGAFLDKIFQHQIALPPLRARALTEFARALADTQAEGVWAEIRAVGSDFYDRTIFALIPVHVRSPRRVKVLLNNFATSVRIAEARGVPWLERVHEIAVLAVLQTEFPTVADDLRRVPRLLTYIRGDDAPSSAEVSEIVGRYVGVGSPTGNGTSQRDVSEDAPSEELLNDDDSPTGQLAERKATETLRRQLNSYLGKVSAAGLQDPRPDLLYLKPAANRDRLPDPSLGDAIDFATDTAPEQVVDAFQDEESSTLAVAIPLLVIEGDNAVGLGKRFSYESACLLVERLDPDDLDLVANQTYPSLLSALTSGALSDEALPGALLVAARAEAPEVVREFFTSRDLDNLPESLRTRLTPLLSHVDDRQASEVMKILAHDLATAPEPLLVALSTAPVSVIGRLWTEIADSVIDSVNQLEFPAPEPDEASPTSGGTRPPAQGSQTESQPEATGQGVALAERLVEAALGRPDGEALVSSVFASFQTRPAKTPIVQWTLAHADRIVAPMASPERKARHALLGIKAFVASLWDRWGELLPPAPSESPDTIVRDLATHVVSERLLPAFAIGASSRTPSGLAELTRRVAEWSSLSDDALAETASEVLKKTAWADADDPDARATLWDVKLVLYPLLLDLASDSSSAGTIGPLVVDDLVEVLATYPVDRSVVEPFVRACNALPATLHGVVSERLDAYEAPADETAAVLLLRLLVRAGSDGEPIPVANLLELAETDRSSAITDAWLTLKPAWSDVADVLTSFPVTLRALDTYAGQLGEGDRTNLWIQAERKEATNEILRSIGRAGVGAAAVDHVRASVDNLSRQPERAEKVARLRQAKRAEAPTGLGSLQRSAADLARGLLGRNVAGDVRVAAEVMCWAGGAAHGDKTELRGLFDNLVSEHPGAVTQTIFSNLEDLGLLSRRKSLRERVFGPRD